MMEKGAFGSRMADYLHLDGATEHARLGSGSSALAVTRLHAPNGFADQTRPIPVEKAFSIHLHLRPTQGGRLWLGGKLIPTGKRPSGGVTILDLEQEPIAFFPNPIDVVQFYIPRTALEEFAYENGTAKVETLSWPHCSMDATLKHLGLTVLSTLQRGQTISKLFLDSIGQTVLAHATSVYGGVRNSSRFLRGQLAPWQVRRAKEYLRANLHGNISLASVAAECGLSISHFARSFQRTFGRPPHRWLMEQRVEAVKGLLLSSSATLAEIAGQCGFADQSGLNRTFKRMVGESPGTWRRSRKGHV